MGRGVSEMVSTYCNRFYTTKPELAARRIEAIGYQVGLQLFERYTMERPRFSDHLEAIKFICKDFWSEVFKKQIDNLKTNHRGTFVLQDNRFRWLTHMSINPSANEELSPDPSLATPESKAAQSASTHLYFPCGIIRGALTNLGIPCAVSADMSNLPACSFVVRIKAGWNILREETMKRVTVCRGGVRIVDKVEEKEESKFSPSIVNYLVRNANSEIELETDSHNSDEISSDEEDLDEYTIRSRIVSGLKTDQIRLTKKFDKRNMTTKNTMDHDYFKDFKVFPRRSSRMKKSNNKYRH